MTGMKLDVYHSALLAANAVAQRVATVLAAKPNAALILPAGLSPIPLYRELVRRSSCQEIDFSRARIFQLDEYVGVGLDDQRSFRSQLHRDLIDLLPAPPAESHLLDGCAQDPAAEIARLAQELLDGGGADLAILGLGRNGHVAFNEPGSSGDGGARVVKLHRETLAGADSLFHAAPMPTSGMTLGLKELRASRQIAMLVTGGGKAAILKAIIDQPPTGARPASLLLDHADLTIFCDEDAAAALAERSTGSEVTA